MHLTVKGLVSSATVPFIQPSSSDIAFDTFVANCDLINIEDYFRLIKRFAISSVEVSEQYDDYDLTTLTGSFIDNEQFKIIGVFGKTGANPVNLRSMAFKPVVQILHSGELLTNFRISIEQSDVNQCGMLVYSNIVNNSDYIQSQDKSDFIAKQTFGNLKNL